MIFSDLPFVSISASAAFFLHYKMIKPVCKMIIQLKFTQPTGLKLKEDFIGFKKNYDDMICHSAWPMTDNWQVVSKMG